MPQNARGGGPHTLSSQLGTGRAQKGKKKLPSKGELMPDSKKKKENNSRPKGN